MSTSPASDFPSAPSLPSIPNGPVSGSRSLPVALAPAPNTANTANTPDTIHLRGLAVSSRIGATPEEQAFPQRLLLDLEIVPLWPFNRLEDSLARTVDYAAVSQEIITLAADRPRHLLETLAVDCASHILQHHAAREVGVRIRKFILPETEYVAVEHRQFRPEPPEQAEAGNSILP